MTVTVRRPTSVVSVAGSQVLAMASLRIAYGYDQRIGEANVVVAAGIGVSLPAQITEGAAITITTGATAPNTLPRFVGTITKIDTDLFPNQVTLYCRGPLYRASIVSNPDPVDYDLSQGGVGQYDQDMVGALLDKCGLPADQYPRALGGTSQNLGAVAGALSGNNQFVWQINGEHALDVIDRIDQISCPTAEPGAYRTFEAVGGLIVRSLTFVAGALLATFINFTEGVDLEVQSRVETDIEAIKNKWIVTGFTDITGIPFTASVFATSPYLPTLPTGPAYNVGTYSSGMIEKNYATDAPAFPGAPGSVNNGIACSTVADYLLSQQGNKIVSVVFTTPRDDLITPGTFVGITSARLGLDNAPCWVQHVEINHGEDGAWYQQITAQTSAGAPVISPPPPQVDFTISVLVETIVVSGAEQLLYVVTCVATAVSPSGVIVNYSWSATAGNPATDTGQYESSYVVGMADPTGQSVTLQVTDSNSQTTTVTKPVPTQTAQVYVAREIDLAATADAETYDPTATLWRVLADPHGHDVDEVAPGSVWGAGVDVMLSTDYLQTVTTVQPFGATAVASVWTESDVSSAILAGSADGKLAYSADGTTFGTPFAVTPAGGAAILRCAINRFNTMQWYALWAGGIAYTTNAGVGWIVVQAAASGETFNDFCLSHTRSMVAISGGSRYLIELTSGTAQTFPSTPTTGILSVQPDIQYDRFYCYDADGNTFVTTPPSGDILQAGAPLPSGCAALVRAMWRDGSVRQLLYIAGGTGGAWKSLNGLQTADGYYQERKPGVGNSPSDANYVGVGAGALLQQAPPPPVAMGTLYAWNSDHLYVRVSPGTWSLILTTAPAGTGLDSLASPVGLPLVLYTVGTTPQYAATSTDGGATWTVLTGNLLVRGGFDTSASCRPGVAGTVYFASRDSGSSQNVQESTDGGTTFSAIAPNVYSYAWTPNSTRVWTYAGGGVGVPEYTDDNFSTTQTISGATFLAETSTPVIGDADTLYCLDGGTTNSVRLADAVSNTSVSIAPAGTSGQRMLGVRGSAAGTVILVSSDGSGTYIRRGVRSGLSVTWTLVATDSAVNTGFGPAFHVVAADPTNASHWCVTFPTATGSVLYESTDDGLTWTTDTACPGPQCQVTG